MNMAHETPPMSHPPSFTTATDRALGDVHRQTGAFALASASLGSGGAASDSYSGSGVGSDGHSSLGRAGILEVGGGVPDLPRWWSVLLAIGLGSCFTALCLLMAAWSSVVAGEVVKEVEHRAEVRIPFPELLRPPLQSMSSLGETPTVAAAWTAPSLPGPVPLPVGPQAGSLATSGAPPGTVASGLAGLSLTGGAALLLSSPSVSEPMVFDEEAVDQPPRAVGEREHTYPAEALALQVEGYVRLRLRIDEDGRVQEVRVLDAAPPGVFEASAVEDARQWRFSPARHEGSPVEVWATTRVDYALE